MPNVAYQVRSTLNSEADRLPLNDLLSVVDEFALECASTEEIERIEDELQKIYSDGLAYTTLEQTEVFISVLYHLGPILPSTSVISWFDLILRPALREPKLSTQVVNHAKELIVSSLYKENETSPDRIRDFRRRLMEFYLLDALNESSGDDILEWAELSQDDRHKRTYWKHNLEDILLRFGNERPEDLFDEINTHFADPSSRLQLISLLNIYSNAPDFASAIQVLSEHPLMPNLLLSLFLDNSSTAATLGITLLVKLLPFLALYARQGLKGILPKLLAILVRIMCWKERRASKGGISLTEGTDADLERELEYETNPILDISPDIEWERLEMSFHAATSLPPSSRNYFTMLYYLYPANLLKFLRSPAEYLQKNGLSSPYVQTWEQAFDADEVQRRSKDLIQEHSCHPMLVLHDELSESEFWANYDISRVVSEAFMLDLRNMAVVLRARHQSAPDQNLAFPLRGSPPSETSSVTENNSKTQEGTSTTSPQFIRPIDISSGKAVIFLQDMISSTLALKNNLDLEVVQPSSQWPHSLFQTNSIPTLDSQTPPTVASHDENVNAVALAISGLQREILLLRNDLNFELWLSRENAKHIGRLYEERVVLKSTEAERQGLYNKLRSYRGRVNRLENELQEQIRKASNAKSQYADWNAELQQKLKELKEEKRGWTLEVATLRRKENEMEARFTAQGKLLAEANKEVFELQTQRKANQHKIDRLHDYETQIKHFLEVRKTWDEDFARFNAREEEVKVVQTQHKQIQLQLASMEETQLGMEEKARNYRRQIQVLEARLTQMRQKSDSSSLEFAEKEISAYAEEKNMMTAINDRLKEENDELKDEVMELKAMVELLKAQHTRQRGLISEPRSPVLVGPS